ncbi:MAG: 4-alpha-glucanotransferase [Actinomycetota bacterium]
MNLDAWGIDEGYRDMHGRYRRAPESTIAALVESMGAETDEPGGPGVDVVEQGGVFEAATPANLLLEDGGSVSVDGLLPPDVPTGYHRLEDRGSGAVRPLIVVPRSCYLPPDLWAWGWALQLYALRSGASWGIGDLGDLRRFGKWAAARGAGFCLINPLHSSAPPEQASPYFPGSRVWRNPDYIDVDGVPGAGRLDELGEVRARARRLNDDRRIDRAHVHRLKDAALRKLWRAFRGDEDFDRFCRGDPTLDAFAAFVVLAELHGDDPRHWPVAYRRGDRGSVERVLRDHPDRSGFVKWQQWLLRRQLRDASQTIGVVGDLAVGVNRDGFDAWYWRDAFAADVTVGAPPDDFNLDGQGWGVLAFDPHKLRAVAYEPFILMLRRALEYAGGVRLDHVMGLWRLFWIPDGESPASGTYVRYPARELLGIVALESHRARAFVIGEDLGTVEGHVRSEMVARALLSYRLLYFEETPPAEYPVEALAAVTNHDLPTLAGLWSGVDLQAQAGAGVEPNVDFATGVKERLCRLTELQPDAGTSEAIRRAYLLLARAPSRLTAATLEDALGVVERPNQPGTVTGYPNWSLALPHPLEVIEQHDGPEEIARLLGNRPRGQER